MWSATQLLRTDRCTFLELVATCVLLGQEPLKALAGPLRDQVIHNKAPNIPPPLRYKPHVAKATPEP